MLLNYKEYPSFECISFRASRIPFISLQERWQAQYVERHKVTAMGRLDSLIHSEIEEICKISLLEAGSFLIYLIQLVEVMLSPIFDKQRMKKRLFQEQCHIILSSFYQHPIIICLCFIII